MAQSGDLGAARAETIGDTILRYEKMSDALAVLQSSGPFTRAYNAIQFNDLDVARAAVDDFKPAVPVTFEGAVFTGVGFVGGWIAIALVLGILRRLIFGRRRASVA
jgi:hypothetical protein